jgi:2-keto-4-pentenoate hydratase/2-oxohepta-3-ene-1,7-dioic acid hydratase in catechol pathway
VRQRDDGILEVLDLPYHDIGELLRAGVALAATAVVVDEMPVESAEPLAPVRRPGKVVIAGGNYLDHVKEAGLRTPQEVPFVVASGDVVIGPHDNIVLPAEAPHFVDYEGEVAIVIGKAGSHVAANRALEYVGGLTIVNDVTARDVQLRGLADGTVADVGYIVRAKQFPTFKPTGPAVVTVDEFTDPLDVRITTRVNGEVRQDSRTTQMIFGIPHIIEAVSAAVDLAVGDLVLTGTPAGVALAGGVYLQDGDTVDVTVENIGVLSNTVVRGA